MVAFTPNRNYPYAQPTDPADVPERLQAFAEAVDSDLRFWELQGQPRNMAQFLGNVPNTIPGTATSGTFTWQLTDFNTRRLGTGSPGYSVVPVTDATTTLLTVNYPGFWYVSCTAQLQSVPTGSGVDLVGMELLQNATVVNTNPTTLTHDVTFQTDNTHTLDVSGGLFMAAGDTVAVRGRVGRSAGAAPVRFINRSITLLRMTLS